MPALQSITEQWVCMLPTPVRQCTVFWSLFSYCTANLHTPQDLPVIQVFINQTPMPCNTVQGKMLPALFFCAAVPNKLTAVLWHCIYTCQDMPFIHVFINQTPMFCSRVQGKMHALLLCAAVLNKVTAVACHCIYTCQDLPRIHPIRALKALNLPASSTGQTLLC